MVMNLFNLRYWEILINTNDHELGIRLSEPI